ncbi:unnamed protein product [Thelazia callipaeda]|uniref:DNA (cytosine-5-)-methyltransferase n=1 Tax=Thelazia callipaeda TaxID=103827 RepID=A0A0N5CQZ7_THECL|nr:unnamed protein product [Thelazia callipaeda]
MLPIRYLSWREVVNFLGFPATLMKPPEISVKQMYRSLGNSITVSGVSLLIQHLLHPCNVNVKCTIATPM